MRFLLRSFLGLIILSITLGFLIFGSFVLFDALKKRSEKSDNRRFQKERVFAVNVETLVNQTAKPKIFSPERFIANLFLSEISLGIFGKLFVYGFQINL